jgi:pimeloyl-ACP methyl ester carboxylesterase
MSAEQLEGVPAPAWWKLALESRAPFEWGASLAAWPLLAAAPHGDGHAVLVFPGMVASDISTLPMRRLLRWLGHDAHGWAQGRNLGPRPPVLAAALQRIQALRKSSGRKVSLVGQSLGGIYARELAKQAPDDVRCVVTLGTPFTGGARSTNAWRLFEKLNGREHLAPGARAAVRQAPPVPTTSIYSRSDGVVAWQCSVQHSGAQTENIEVETSHTGMGVNALVLAALADRLAQPEGAWLPHDRSGVRRVFYRQPDRAPTV